MGGLEDMGQCSGQNDFGRKDRARDSTGADESQGSVFFPPMGSLITSITYKIPCFITSCIKNSGLYESLAAMMELFTVGKLVVNRHVSSSQSSRPQHVSPPWPGA